MPQVCSVCTHPERDEIDRLILAGEPLRDIAGQFGISRSTLHRHKKGGHIPVSLIVEREAEESERGETLSELARRILSTVIGIMDGCLEEGDKRTALMASKEVREYIRLLESMTGGGDEISVADDPGWQEVMRMIGQLSDNDPAVGEMVRERLAAAATD
jgi:hypothetical protein